MLDLILSILPDALTVADTLHADTIGDVVDDITGVIGGYIEFIILAVLGFVNKFLVDGAKMVQKYVDKLPDGVVATIAFGTSQVIVFINAYLIGWGAPELAEDPSMLVTGLQGLVVWFVSMGWHDFIKHFVTKKEDDTE